MFARITTGTCAASHVLSDRKGKAKQTNSARPQQDRAKARPVSGGTEPGSPGGIGCNPGDRTSCLHPSERVMADSGDVIAIVAGAWW
jgi:hypothetical protein